MVALYYSFLKSETQQPIIHVHDVFAFLLFSLFKLSLYILHSFRLYVEQQSLTVPTSCFLHDGTVYLKRNFYMCANNQQASLA